MTLIVVALAATRLTRAFLFEKIGEPFRNRASKLTQPRFEMIGEPGDAEMVVLDNARTLAIKEWFDELINCSHCVGFWFALGCVVASRFRPPRPFVRALAAAALHSAIVEHYPEYEPADPDDD